MALRKGDIVTYAASNLRMVEAIVEIRHANGDYTVKATFQLDSKGNQAGTYMGYTYRMRGADLTLRYKAQS